MLALSRDVIKRIDAKISSVAALSVGLWAAACSSGSPTEMPGDSVLTSAVVSASLQSLSGGFGPAVPSGAACDPGKWTYVITLATHDVTWTGCNVNGSYTDSNSYAPATVDHPVDSAHWPAVHLALAGVSVSDNTTSCGADKGTEVLTIQRSSDAVTYGDDFYACLKQYSNYVVSSSLDDLYAALSTLP